MPPTKFYRNVKYLLDRYLFSIITCLVIAYIFPIIFIKSDSTEAALELFIFCVMIISMGIAIFISWYLLKHIIKFKQVSFEITTDGFYCPSLLKQNRLIKWDEIKNIKLERNSRKPYPFYTVIELIDSIEDIGDMHNFLFCPYDYYQEKSSGIVLVIPQEAINYYDLKDFTDLLLSFKGKKINPVDSSYKIHTINYKDSNKGFLIFLNLACVSASVACIFVSTCFLYYMIIKLVLTIPYITNVICILLIICLTIRNVFSWIITTLLNFFIEKKYLKTAIEFDDKGIYLINDKSYFPLINWKDFRSCHLVDIKSDKEGVFRPVIEIEFNHSDAKVTKEIIRNALEGTSVFELQEKLNLYKSSISNPSGSPS